MVSVVLVNGTSALMAEHRFKGASTLAFVFKKLFKRLFSSCLHQLTNTKTVSSAHPSKRENTINPKQLAKTSSSASVSSHIILVTNDKKIV